MLKFPILVAVAVAVVFAQTPYCVTGRLGRDEKLSEEDG